MKSVEEYFDLCTINRKSLGRKCVRGSKLNENEFHVVVMAVLLNSDHEVLLTKRSPEKIAAGMWECTAGSVLAGESSKEAIKREIQEELGIFVEIKGYPISEYREDDALFDIWTANIDVEIEDLVLQKKEVAEAKYATLNEIKEMIESGVATKSLGELIKLNDNGIITIKGNHEKH